MYRYCCNNNANDIISINFKFNYIHNKTCFLFIYYMCKYVII